ncbi:hypothetical protein BP6252_12426 [Coleophoma cylindrospora]|uniref:2EXR domain-containing protein n=1 Tax=Coleophoma cylindrospora TaxID=1849047 RepID=A0A3D8QGT1_9HELO|nr:hypothetical protein BP6252_12426 [Coleophoma cylindrospora]
MAQPQLASPTNTSETHAVARLALFQHELIDPSISLTHQHLHSFAVLPPELRLRIWRFSLPRGECPSLPPNGIRDRSPLTRGLPRPLALSVNRESRYEALRHFVAVPCVHKRWFESSLWTLYLPTAPEMEFWHGCRVGVFGNGCLDWLVTSDSGCAFMVDMASRRTARVGIRRVELYGLGYASEWLGDGEVARTLVLMFPDLETVRFAGYPKDISAEEFRSRLVGFFAEWKQRDPAVRVPKIECR